MSVRPQAQGTYQGRRHMVRVCVRHKREEDMYMAGLTHEVRRAEWCTRFPHPLPLTFVVQRAIKVVAARVEAGGQLD